MSAKPNNVFYAQSGGVTAVINASACGVIETARKQAASSSSIGKVYAGRNGIIGALREELIDTGMEGLEPQVIEEAMKIVPMKRMGAAEEVAGLASYLMSDIAGYVTRQVISINGGML